VWVCSPRRAPSPGLWRPFPATSPAPLNAGEKNIAESFLGLCRVWARRSKVFCYKPNGQICKVFGASATHRHKLRKGKYFSSFAPAMQRKNCCNFFFFK
jgi:hypothetical protein